MRRADHSSRGDLPSVLCLTESDREASIMRKSWPTGRLLRHGTNLLVAVLPGLWRFVSHVNNF